LCFQANNTGQYVPRTCCVKHEDSEWPDVMLVDEAQCQIDALLETTDSKSLYVEVAHYILASLTAICYRSAGS